MATLDELRTRLETLISEKNSMVSQRDSAQAQYRALVKERKAAMQSGNYDLNDPAVIARNQKISQLDNEVLLLNDDIDKILGQINTAEARVRSAEADQASTKENNSGTGEPGTAGEGADASKPKQVEPPAVTADEDPFEAARLEKEKKLAEANEADTLKTAPTPIDPKTDPDVKKVNPETGEVYTTGERINPETGEPYTPVPAANPGNTTRGIPGATKNARAQATLQDTTNFQQKKDWRVRLSLSPGANYLYKDSSNTLLAPLRKTDGIIFPYTPTINVTYGANYQPAAPVHSNYKIFQYENSYVDNVTITCEFTAQDTAEANYLLAVIHFLRSVTKMFYGQDQNPKPGTPPPLCYLFGLGEFQFNAQPLAITNFTYNLPNDVDYIRAGALTLPPGVTRAEQGDNSKSNTSKGGFFDKAASALAQGAISKLGGTAKSLLGQLMPGGKISGPNFSSGFNANIPPGTKEPTYVPTKISITIQALPIVSRYEVSNNFSVKDYANGKLLNGVKRAGGGFW